MAAILAAAGSVACALAVVRGSDALRERPPAHVALFVTADLRGYLAPCGCSENMRGGIARAAEQIALARRDGLPTLYADSGDSLFHAATVPPEAVPQEERKAKAIAEAMKQMGLVARTSGERDDARGAAFREGLGLPGLAPGEAKVVEANGRAIGFAAGNDADTLRQAARVARKDGAEFVVGLFHGTARAAQQAAQTSEPPLGADAIVVSHAESDLDGETNKLLRGSIPVMQPQNKGRSLLRIDVWFGPRAGPFELLATQQDAQRQLDALDERIALLDKQINLPGLDEPAKQLRRQKLAELTRRRETLATQRAPSGEGRNALSVRFIPLEASLPADRGVEAVLQRYDKDVGLLNLAWAKAHGHDCPAPEANQAAFVGNARCRDCHEEAFPIWEASKHAHAYATLEDKSKQYHLDCIACHVTGWQRPGGVCRIDKVDERKGVGCESCHGPGSLHAEDPSDDNISKGNTPQTCTGCHDPENSPHFDFDAYVRLITGPGHGNSR
ncbi:MAG: cytochrome C [Myxococcaceae bacterium]|nr:cytochrome C [Myxococcaceae bacterium]